LGNILKRQEAISVLKELLDNCAGLGGHSLEYSVANAAGGYQIIIKGALNEETKKQIQTITAKNHLGSQTGSLWKTKRALNKTESDTLIIYKPKN